MNTFLKFLRTGFHILHWIRKDYGIQIPPFGCSLCHHPSCLCKRRRGGGGGDNVFNQNGTKPNKGGNGGWKEDRLIRGWIPGRFGRRGQISKEGCVTLLR